MSINFNFELFYSHVSAICYRVFFTCIVYSMLSLRIVRYRTTYRMYELVTTAMTQDASLNDRPRVTARSLARSFSAPARSLPVFLEEDLSWI
jgi:hypothetical protein